MMSTPSTTAGIKTVTLTPRPPLCRPTAPGPEPWEDSGRPPRAPESRPKFPPPRRAHQAGLYAPPILSKVPTQDLAISATTAAPACPSSSRAIARRFAPSPPLLLGVIFTFSSHLSNPEVCFPNSERPSHQHAENVQTNFWVSLCARPAATDLPRQSQPEARDGPADRHATDDNYCDICNPARTNLHTKWNRRARLHHLQERNP